MFLETIKSEGLAHLSYVFGSDGRAAVVDPRRDVEVYVETAAAHGCRITDVLETHRNEDLVSGSAVLAKQTGARVLHGPNPAAPVRYAQTVGEGTEFGVGQWDVRVLETPGHTDDSLSYVLSDRDFPEGAVAVFTGDTLFVGDVGRCDFYPDRAEEVAGLMFDSLRKLEALGDQVLVCPAHGAGSVCGSGMAERDFSTMGHERANNPRLGIGSRDAFIEAKLAEHHPLPPYFERMERLNLEGADAVPRPAAPPPLTGEDFEDRAGAVVVDVRSASAFLGAHVPGSLALPLDALAAYAGWLLDAADDLALVANHAAEAEEAAVRLARIGFDRVRGYLQPDLTGWAAGGRAFGTLPVIGSGEVRRRLERGEEGWTLLDVRGREEVASARIPGSEHVFLGDLPAQCDRLDPRRRYTVMCGSGTRATIAASVLARAGFERVDLFLGSLGAWLSRGFETRGAD